MNDSDKKITLPTGTLTLASALEHFGRDRFDELLVDFDWDAQLSDDGEAVFTFEDPRNHTGSVNVTDEFLAWLKDEAAKP